METLLGLLVRYLHVAGAVVWVGGYAVLALAIVPRLTGGSLAPISASALATSRLMSIAGAVTMVGGLILIPLTRGYGSLGTQWGISLLVGIVLSVAMMGFGDGALRPALRRVGEGDVAAIGPARRWATLTFLLGLVVLFIMLLLPRTPTP